MSARPNVADCESVGDLPRDDVDEVVGHVAVAGVPGHLNFIQFKLPLTNLKESFWKVLIW